MNFDKKIEELFLELPESPTESLYVGNVMQSGKLLFVGGVLPWKNGKMAFKGRVGLELSLDAGKSAGNTAVIQALGILKSYLGGSLNKIKQIISVKGYVASGSEFYEHHKVLDSAGELLHQVFGSVGRHARTAIGVNSLPFNATIELELIVEIK